MADVGSYRDFFDQFAGPGLAAMLAGTALSVQVIVNSQARIRLAFDHPLQATLLNFVGGTLVLGIVCALCRFSWPTLERAAAVPWWIWFGCLGGMFYITVSVLLSPRLGIALFFTLVVAGQMLSAIVLDHFGMFGTDVKPVNLGRIAGVLLVLAGVYVVSLSTPTKPPVEPPTRLVPIEADPELPSDF
jgi:bacterial/archaeal transporter family-2 protein